ncbi:MAG: AAA family ATPase, partial [Anaerolineales bacterium]|nr:AAA family ATPase [Anaerolineales bacterium]
MSERLLLPKKLYGREPARSRLLHALDEADRGRARRVLLAGDAGVGKTALVAELAEPVIARGGLLLTCQAEVQQQMPYTAVISLLEAFIRQLLVLEPAQMQAWQAKLAHALAGHVDRLCKHLPLLGTFLEAPYAAPAETADPQQSLHLALQTCFTTIAAAARPLILFVDDAHTADADSLRLLNDLVKNSRLRLLILWAYRPEPPPAYLQAYVDAAPADDRLVLQPLAPSETRAFLVDALCTTPDACARLAEVIHVRTRGNPFLLHEVLRLLHDQALIHFDPQHRAWRWDLAQIRAAPLADNVVDLLHDRLQQLPAPAQRTLKVAALLGSSFALDLLAAACAQTPAETMQAVQQALALGAVAPLAEKNLFPLPQLAHPTDSRAAAMQQLSARYMTPRPADRRQAAQPATVTHPESAVLPAPDARLYRFAHEQVRTAARRLQPDLPEAAIHRQIGRRLLHSLPPEQRQRHAFLIVGHLNQDAAGQADWAGRTDAAQLNLSAGRDALALVAYESALSLALCGIDWLGMDGGWQTAPVLMRELHLTAAQAATRLGRFEQAVRLLDTTEM